MLSIILLTYNRLAYTKQTLENLIAKTTIPHQYILVDNGSVDGTREYLKSMEHKTNALNVIYKFNDHNLGVAGGRNEGLLVAGGDIIMTIDDDIIVPENYDIMLKEAWDKVENLGITGISLEKKKFGVVDFNGVKMQVKKGNLGGGCLCFSRKMFEKLGFFYNGFVYGIEDVDMYFRVERLGLINAYIEANGEHIDEHKDQNYFNLKRSIHGKKSKEFSAIGKRWRFYKIRYKQTGSVYVPYREPNVEKYDTRFNIKADNNEN